MPFPRRHPELYPPEYDQLRELGAKRTRKQDERLRELAQQIRRKRRALEARTQRRRQKAERFAADQAEPIAQPVAAEAPTGTADAAPPVAVEPSEDRSFPSDVVAPPEGDPAQGASPEREPTPAEVKQLITFGVKMFLDVGASVMEKRGYDPPEEAKRLELAVLWGKVIEAYDVFAGQDPRTMLLVTAIVSTGVVFGGPVIAKHMGPPGRQGLPEPVEARAPAPS